MSKTARPHPNPLPKGEGTIDPELTALAQQGLNRRIPRGAVRSSEHGGGFVVADDRLAGRVPANLPAETERDVRELAGRRDAMSALKIGDGLLPRLDAVEKVADVQLELLA